MNANLRSILVPVLALLVAAAARAGVDPAAASPPGAGFAVRIVALSGDPDRADTREHVKFSRKLGFNALWITSGEAGVWTKEAAAEGPRLAPGFLRLTKSSRKLGVDVWVAIEPGADAGERFTFTDEDASRRLLAFAGLLHEKAGVRHIVLSFADQPMQLHELSDIFAYGSSAARPQLDLARRLGASLPGDVETWLTASAFCDEHLEDETTPYPKEFLEGVGSLPPGMGIVWTGPKPRSPKITRGDLEAVRARLGNRPLLLDDAYPANDDDEDDAMALILGALRERDAGIRDVVAGYLSRPENPLAGSRLSLLTIAQFLDDPPRYDPDLAASGAVARLAGKNSEAATGLSIQQLEWGGFIDGRNYWPREALNPEATAGRLHDPAFVSSFTWTVDRYPGRMAQIERAADKPFRDDLLRTMRRRLAIGRAIPLVIEYLARVRTGSGNSAEMLARIDEERRSWARDPDARRVLELFLSAAEVPPLAATP